MTLADREGEENISPAQQQDGESSEDTGEINRNLNVCLNHEVSGCEGSKNIEIDAGSETQAISKDLNDTHWRQTARKSTVGRHRYPSQIYLY